MRLKSKIAAVALTVPLGVALAGPASASVTPESRSTVTAKTGAWSPWANVPIGKPFHFTACGGHRVEIRDYIKHLKHRTRKITTRYGPAIEIEYHGRFMQKMVDHTADTSALINNSGSAVGRNSMIAYKDGAFLYRATGASFVVNTSVMAHTSGLPRLAVMQGRVGILYGKHNGTWNYAKIVTKPDSIVDACTLLK